MNVSTIKDTIKDLAQSLRATTILPASLLVIANLYLVLPLVWKEFDSQLSSVKIIAVGLTLMGSYVLYAFNFPLIRLLEGYKFKETDWHQRNLTKQRKEFSSLVSRINELRRQRKLFVNRLGFDPDQDDQRPLSEEESIYWDSSKAQLSELEYRFDRHFPSSIHAVLPTRLGNTIAAFEDYPRTRYGMDTIALWPRLVPILKEEQFTDFVTQEKSVLDFLLNMLVVVLVLSIELTYLALFLGRFGFALGICLFASIVSWMLYQGSVIAARQWGTTVRVAFDLYRHNLWHRLGLRPTERFQEEYILWQQVSRFLLYRHKGAWFEGFRSQAEMENVLKLTEEKDTEDQD